MPKKTNEMMKKTISLFTLVIVSVMMIQSSMQGATLELPDLSIWVDPILVRMADGKRMPYTIINIKNDTSIHTILYKGLKPGEYKLLITFYGKFILECLYTKQIKFARVDERQTLSITKATFASCNLTVVLSEELLSQLELTGVKRDELGARIEKIQDGRLDPDFVIWKGPRLVRDNISEFTKRISLEPGTYRICIFNLIGTCAKTKSRIMTDIFVMQFDFSPDAPNVRLVFSSSSSK